MKKGTQHKTILSMYNVAFGALSILIVACLIGAIQYKSTKAISKVVISVQPLKDHKFLVKADDVISMMNKASGFEIDRARFKDIDTRLLEKTIESNKAVKHVEVYVDKHNVIKVEIEQKNPVARVELSSGQDYYLDEFGADIPCSKGAAIRVPVVTGKVDAYTANFSEHKNHNLNKVLAIANQMNNDTFLSALVEQIHVESNGKLILVPKIGDVRIVFSDIFDLDHQMSNLKKYFKEAVPELGIDHYKQIDLSYEGQIVGIN